MKKLPAPPLVHWWDWTAVVLLLLLLQTLATRLIATEWTPSLGILHGFLWMGAIIGLALGYSAIPRRRARWLSFSYMIVMLPLQWTTIIEGSVALEEKLASLSGRMWFSLSELLSKRPVEDPLFFLAIMSILFWVLGASAGYQLTRHQNFIAAIVPSMFGMLVIQHYDNVVHERMWAMAFFVMLALLLLGQMNFLRERNHWRDKRIFISPENGLDLSSGMAIAAGLLIILAWITPPSFIRIETARQAWNRITKPWTEFADRFENAVSALESQTGGSPSAGFYGSQLELGLGFSLSETVLFTVETPELSSRMEPPRYYWRGRVYDQYSNGRWSATGTQSEEFSPEAPRVESAQGKSSANFIFQVGEQPISLLSVPAQAIWVSRPGSTVHAPVEEEGETLAWNVSPRVLPGETYRVESALSNPNIEELRAAGIEYPQWVMDRYLQLPDDVSPRIAALAGEITVDADTPFDQAAAVTRYLRETIEYAPTIPAPPLDADPLEWILFTHKKAYCVYYASLEIVMLRSLGIPARMAVGFAEGTPAGKNISGEETDETDPRVYTVREMNAHAWPEVYFPGIGWVEFEPTGNQEPLERPPAPLENDPSSEIGGPSNTPIGPEADRSTDENIPDGNLESTGGAAARAPLFVFLALSIAAVLGMYLSRRYALPSRLPSLVRASIERGGIETPRWVLNWEHWVKLSAVERSFESVNFALRQVGEALPIHATPAERADKLVTILPELTPSVKALLDEQLTSLYTSRIADAKRARRAAWRVRSTVLLAHLRYFWTGKYSS